MNLTLSKKKKCKNIGKIRLNHRLRHFSYVYIVFVHLFAYSHEKMLQILKLKIYYYYSGNTYAYSETYQIIILKGMVATLYKNFVFKMVLVASYLNFYCFTCKRLHKLKYSDIFLNKLHYTF